MPAAAAAPLIKGLLGAGARGAATGGARAVAGNAVKGGAKEGMKKFAQGMTGKTSSDYKARVDGVNPETGEYLTPEERKARFKGFATAPTKPGAQKLLSAGPSQAVAALPPAGGVGAGADTGQEKVVNHLEKIQMYLEKLLIIELNALSRLQDKILATAREDDRAAAAAEEEKQEKGKTKKKTGGNPIVNGMKKKAKGIFGFLMDFAMKFVGMKILDWISKPENQEKIEKIVGFFQGVVGFITTVGKFIGDTFNFSVEVIQKGIEGITFLAGKVQEFFTFEWLDIDKLLEPLQPIISFFTETIPNAMDSFLDGLAGVIQKLDALPNQFVGIVESITNGFLEFIGLPPAETEDFKDTGDKTDPIPTDGKSLVPDTDPGDGQPKDDETPAKMKKGGYLSGRTHAQGGEVRELEGGEYVFNRRAVAAIGRKELDKMNFGMYPAVGKDQRENPKSMAATGGFIEKYKEGGFVHPKLKALSDENIKKAHAKSGLCVTGSLLTMEKSGAGGEGIYTSADVGNNPRGAMVQLQQSPHNWKSIGGQSTLLKSPYGQVNTGIFSKDQYLKLVEDGKIPSGALIFQTRHSSWNGTSYNSRGYDMAIAQKQGRALWNGVPINDPLVYANTQKVAVLTPDGKQGDGSKLENMDSGAKPSGTIDNTGGSGTSTTPSLPEVDLSVLKAILSGPGGGSSAPLGELQSENNVLTSPGAAYAGAEEKIVLAEKSPAFTTGFDENVIGGLELGDNIPPFTQAVFPFNL